MNRIKWNIYEGINGMAKKQITVIIEGDITEKIERDFHDRLAMALIDQYGIEVSRFILKELQDRSSQ